MSSRANLLPPPIAQAGGGSTPPTTTTPRTFTLPTIDDPIVMQMRPTHVAQVLLGEGGEATIFDAFKKAVLAQELHMAIKGLTKPYPTVRVVIGVKPGNYTIADWDRALDANNTPSIERGGIPPFIDVIALDPTRGATTFVWGFSPSQIYWEGVDIRVPATGKWEPKYPIHLSNLGTNIFTRTELYSENFGSGGGGTTIGTDGDNGGCVVLHDVRMKNGGTNQHGGGTLTIPSTCVYSKVTTDPKYGLGFSDNNGIETEFWAVDCITGSIELGANAGHMHVNNCPGATVRHLPATGDGYSWDGTMPGTIDDRRDWPVPVGGLSARDRARYGL